MRQLLCYGSAGRREADPLPCDGLIYLSDPLHPGGRCAWLIAALTNPHARPRAFVPWLRRYMSPCPSGYSGDSTHSCTCQPFQVQRYLQRLSDPLLDRIDIHIEVPRLQHEESLTLATGQSLALESLQ
jgi:hypothetical protein